MKEKYVKPEVELIEFTLTEAVASSCAMSVYNQGQYSCQLKGEFDIWGPNPFAEDNACETPIQGYCYYTSATIVFAS